MYRDENILILIKKELTVGKIYKIGTSVVLRVYLIEELVIIIAFFDKYPLITKKRADYVLLKQAIFIVKNKEHLTISGIKKLIAIKASMNHGLSKKLKSSFPGVVPVVRPLVIDQKLQDPNWLAGFTTGEGSFIINIFKGTTKIGLIVKLEFKLTQHERDEVLIKNLINLFECGGVFRYITAFNFRVTKLDDIVNNIIPFFKKYPKGGGSQGSWFCWLM